MDLKLFVLSDIHAFDGSGSSTSKPSYFDISKSPSGGADNPIHDIHKLISQEKLRADFVVCCGDFCDKAHPASTNHAWTEVQKITTALTAESLISTVGNHDLDSRHKHNEFDAQGVLMDLSPAFPFSDESKNNEFWAQHFSIFTDPRTKARIIVLNSSAYHGERDGPGGRSEYEHGRIAERTIRRLFSKLTAEGLAPINILICHHHPHKHSELYLGEYDQMIGGDQLIREMNTATLGPWIIIHGHKHHPKLCYTTGGTTAPIVFSAGSCAAYLQPELQGHARNQVYEITLEISSSLTSTCSGTFRAWDWGPGLGWNPAQTSSGLPGVGGFGYRGDLGKLAAAITAGVTLEARWDSLKSQYPELRHLLPADLTVLCTLMKQLGLKIEQNGQGEPILVQK